MKQLSLSDHRLTITPDDRDQNLDQLLPLTKDTGGSSFVLAAGLEDALRHMDFGNVLFVDFAVEPPQRTDEVPLIICIPLSSQERHSARFSRKLTWYRIDGTEVCVPPALLSRDNTLEEGPGLGLDLENYQNSNRLLFRVTYNRLFFALEPVGYENGDDYDGVTGEEGKPIPNNIRFGVDISVSR